jgi:hypothetical protein
VSNLCITTPALKISLFSSIKQLVKTSGAMYPPVPALELVLLPIIERPKSISVTLIGLSS